MVSYFEWSQNLNGDTWPEEKVLSRLKETMISAFNDVQGRCREGRCRMRKAAYELAVKRILNAERLKGETSNHLDIIKNMSIFLYDDDFDLSIF